MNRAQVKILYVETIEIRLLDIPRALDELGYDVYKASLNITAQGYNKKDCEKIMAAIDNYEIQCVISYDFAESIAQACHETGIPYISWVYDAPQKELYTHYALYPCNYIFVFDKMQQKRLQEIGIKNVYHVPLAIHANKVKKALKDNKEKRFVSDISFVGQLYKVNNLEYILENADSSICDEIESIIDSCYLKWDDTVELHGRLSENCVNYFSELDGKRIPKKYPYITEQFYYEAAVLSRALANRERVAVLNRLAEQYKVNFYTFDKDTTQLSEKVNILPGVQYDDEISCIYNNSRINLNITLHCIETGACQRIFDVMAAGGFLISNYQKELEELFEVGKEIVLYHDEKELMELVAYYLSHEQERAEIARRGQKKVLEYHNFHEKLQKVMEIVATAEAPRQETYIVMQRNWLKEQANELLPKQTQEAFEKLYDIFSDAQYETTLKKTTELGVIREMLECWKMETENGNSNSNILTDIKNLEDAEYKYLSVKHCLWRIEMQLGYEKCIEMVSMLCQQKTSKLFIAWNIRSNMRDREFIFAQLAKYMQEINPADAIELLSYGLLFYPNHQELLLQRADCLMELGLWEEVLKTLQQIENPGEDIIEMMKELKGALGVNENE